jgi:hypothetical protein
VAIEAIAFQLAGRPYKITRDDGRSATERPAAVDRLPGFKRRMQWFNDNRPAFRESLQKLHYFLHDSFKVSFPTTTGP